ncbi:MAG TPA: TonB-dependent receptor [Caulobacteraceae bacterium]
MVTRRFCPDWRRGGGLALTFGLALGLTVAAGLGSTARAEASLQVNSASDLAGLSIEDLARIDVSSVSKSAQPLSDAPAAIYVITHDDILRSGASSIPQMLRLAPNLYVAQTSASSYVITARGFNGNAADQNFSDKLLVLIDGRSVYSPLFSGVYWDMQDVLPEDIDRIEVISGPGATLWGANAVNGVVNIITRKASETQGGMLAVGGGNVERSASLRYGGKIGADLAYRLYAKGFYDTDTVTSSGAKAHDSWSKPQGGFRLDWTPGAGDRVTLQGDVYQGDESGATVAGGNLLARWNHNWRGGATSQVQTYYDRAHGGGFVLDAYDLDVQNSFALGRRNKIVWGGGLRVSRYTITGTDTFFFVPTRRTLTLGNVFVQDSLSLNGATTLVLGLKLEDDPYSGVTPLPSVRLSWKANDTTLLWAAISRAIRSPTPFDRDVAEKLGSLLFLVGGGNFQPEKLIAYEVGVRVQPSPRLSFSVSGFYNVYDDLRSIEPNPVTFLPLTWGNRIRGHTAGVEAWADYSVTSWWKLSAAFNLLSESLSFKPGDLALVGVEQEGDDPAHQASLRSSMNLGGAVTLDWDLRYVGALPNPQLPSYVELDTRIAWNVSQRVQLSLSGFNLIHDHHQEYPGPQANAVPRSVFAEARLRF